MDLDPTQPALSALVLGLVYGATFCTLTCSPFIASYIVGTDRGAKRGVWLSVVFNSGRILTYGLLGVAAGVVGAAFLEGGAYARWGALVFGVLVTVIGLYIALRRRPAKCGCGEEGPWWRRLADRVVPSEGGGELSAASMGVLIGLVPCPPLLTILVFSATYGSAASGLLLGVLFGIGTVISPILIVSAAAGWFSDRVATEAPSLRVGVQRVAGVLLVVLGVWTAWRAASGGAAPL